MTGASPVPFDRRESGLLTTQAQRNNWRNWLRQARAETEEGDEDGLLFLLRHPRAAALREGFALGAYLAQNLDVAGAVYDPVEALFHYLEFGIPEGRNGMPVAWDRSFVAQATGHRLPEHLAPPQAAAELIARGVSPLKLALREQDHWLILGLHGPALANIFHHETYFAAVEAAGMDLPPPDRLSCIHHYARNGLDSGLPAHPDHRFDADFYASSLAERGISEAACPRHWARFGLHKKIHANARAQALASYGLRLPAGITAASAGEVSRLVEDPMRAIRELDLTRTANRSFAIDLARLQRRRGALASAEKLLMRVLHHSPDDPRARLALAALIRGTRQTPREIALRLVIPADFDGGENRLTLAELCAEKGDHDAALCHASALPTEAHGNVALCKRRRTLARKVFDDLFRNLNRHLERYAVDEVQDLLTRALELYAPTPEIVPRAGQIERVAILANDDLYQCKLYRADQKAEQLRTQGVQVTTFLQSADVVRLHHQLAQFDAVIFQRTPALPEIADLMIEAAKQGLATFFDVDDLIFDASHFPLPLATYAGKVTDRAHRIMACGVPLFAASARLCGYGIASTDPLRALLAPLTISGTAFTHRNALGAAHECAIARATRRRSGRLVIFASSGTKAHKTEFRDVLEPALAQIIAAYRDRVEVRLMGDFPELTHLSPDEVTLLPPIWDFESYAEELAQADIALSVLARSVAADTKSEIKWLEPAMFGIPAVVSASPVMDSVIDNGVTGITAPDSDAFVAALRHLIEDAGARLAIGQAARAKVLRDYALPTMGARLLANMQAARSAQKPKLLIVNVFYPPQSIGGATRVVADNVTHLLTHHSDAFEVDVLTTLDGADTPHEVHTTSHSGARIWSIANDPDLSEQNMRDPVMDARIDELLDRIAPDIVHIHCVQRLGVGIIDACRKRGIPYVLTLHDGWWVSPHQFITGPDGAPELYDFTAPTLPQRARSARRCIEDASAALAVSEPFAELHRKAGLTNVVAMPNGVSTLPERRRQSPPKGRVRLGLIGGASRHKGYDILRAALTSRPFANLDLIVADHALPPGAEAREVWNTTPVVRIPRQPQDKVGALYGRFDVLLAPSIWPESFGLVTREALALGLWVMASDRGAIGSEITEGRNGHIVPVDDHRALAEVLCRIDADPSRYTAPPGVRARLRSAADQGEELVALYKDILSRRA
ncbi:glycosyltransferase [Gymnodinialimonas ceratoperidinii]|uniref:Glycosyltransferase n=1 Tax=Gymnodinialimonas ceratoperidinii TaxID=2856823 RepID=A0A8F6YB98_9RHOB|nr:glycosyltransferase [Gymnodinialimonas ceratoperidinii]QXT39846.1 glycosyltransferase [Gymnodinialimonas ceratoperidinii]